MHLCLHDSYGITAKALERNPDVYTLTLEYVVLDLPNDTEQIRALADKMTREGEQLLALLRRQFPDTPEKMWIMLNLAQAFPTVTLAELSAGVREKSPRIPQLDVLEKAGFNCRVKTKGAKPNPTHTLQDFQNIPLLTQPSAPSPTSHPSPWGRYFRDDDLQR